MYDLEVEESLYEMNFVCAGIFVSIVSLPLIKSEIACNHARDAGIAISQNQLLLQHSVLDTAPAQCLLRTLCDTGVIIRLAKAARKQGDWRWR
jgi:hypothetical protein